MATQQTLPNLPSPQLKVDDEGMITCPECQSQTFEEKKTRPHLGLYCVECGTWIKWIAHPVIHYTNYVLTFGKYKGSRIGYIPTDYLIYGEKNFNGSLRERFRLALLAREAQFTAFATMTFWRLVDREELGTQHNRCTVPDFACEFLKRYPKTNPLHIPYWLDRCKDKMGVTIKFMPDGFAWIETLI